MVMKMSDVKLDGDNVVIESKDDGKLILNGVDLRAQIRELDIDHPPRRLDYSEKRRRAIVHATGDTLGINVNKDYPGGVLIGGLVKIADTLAVPQISANALNAGDVSASHISASDISLSHAYFLGGAPLFINKHIELIIQSASIKITITQFKDGEKLYENTYDVMDEILKLNNKVDELQKEIEILKKNP
jgi:hypothetical protein